MHLVAQAAVAALFLVACSDKTTPPEIAPDKTTPDAAIRTGAPDAGPPLRVCTGPGYATTRPVSFSHLTATVVDTDGHALPNVIAQACGTDKCLNGTTNQDGHVIIDDTTTLNAPAFKYGGGTAYAEFALPLSGAKVATDLGNEVTVAFNPPNKGVPLTPGTSASSRGVALELSPDMNPAAPDPFTFDTEDLRNFRAAEIPVANAPAAVDASLGLGILVALTPMGTALCPAARLTVANTAAWPAGSAVEFFLHGIDIAEGWAPYGGWAKVSDGSVSADGATVTTNDAGGIPQLSVVGVRLAAKP